ncbi:DinB family protein [Leptospira jelokensis]|uniref:DinB family protein n=1 Tax=Leptospira jelokensis TaxID=2484931 RepID=A0A4Z0ZWS4_9LEPT|nr:DinB family protein [Leptospira jelokensis]TGL75481.1 DinB family protein [Leptospira jelokensis]TGM04903.1 DinB family protein [Leptospira jelokensis]
MPSLYEENEILLKEGIALLEILPDDFYHSERDDGLSSVGEHFRHIIEHYQMFLQGIARGYIDYDKRERNLKLETNRTYALEILGTLCLALLQNGIPEGQVLVSQNYNPEFPKPVLSSTIERELLFLVSHTVHHYAIIAMILKGYGFTVPNRFGYSPATLYAKQVSPT